MEKKKDEWAWKDLEKEGKECRRKLSVYKKWSKNGRKEVQQEVSAEGRTEESKAWGKKDWKRFREELKKGRKRTMKKM